MAENPLWQSTQNIHPKILEEYFEKKQNQEDIYCTFTERDVRQCYSETRVTLDELVKEFRMIPDVATVRFIKLVVLEEIKVKERTKIVDKAEKKIRLTFPCKEVGCMYSAYQSSDLKKHNASIHGVDVLYHKCSELSCNFMGKTKNAVKQHRANVHDIEVKVHHCNLNGCRYYAKMVCNLRKHKANVHDIGVKFHNCNRSGCTYRAKTTSNLKVHMSICKFT